VPFISSYTIRIAEAQGTVFPGFGTLLLRLTFTDYVEGVQ